MAVFSIKCPDCDATLKSSKPIPAGKAVTCPKCDITFKVPAQAAAPVDVEVVEDDYDQVEIIDEATAAKEAKAGTAVKRRRPRQQFKKKSNPWPMILAVVGGLLGVGVLGAGGYFGFKFLTTTRSGDPSAYLPDNPGVIFGADLGKIINDTTFGAGLAGMFDVLPPLAAYKRDTNFDPKTGLDKIVVAFNGNPAQPLVTSVALSSKTPLDKQKLAATIGAKEGTIGGRKVYQIEIPNNPFSKPTLIVPNPNLAAMYFGNNNGIDDAVRMGGKANAKPDIAKLMAKAASSHVWAMFDLTAPGSREMLSGATVPGVNTDWMSNLTGLGFWATLVGSDVEINQHFVTANENTAKTVLEALQKEQKAAKGNLMMQGMIKMFGASGMSKDIEETEKYEQVGPNVIYTAKIKMSNLETVLNNLSKMPLPMPSLPGPGRGGRPGRP